GEKDFAFGFNGCRLRFFYGRRLRLCDTDSAADKSCGQILPNHHEPKPFCSLRAFSTGAFSAEPRRWRAASKSTTAPAAETLSDDTLPAIGICSRWSQVFLTRSCRPSPSRPSTT